MAESNPPNNPEIPVPPPPPVAREAPAPASVAVDAEISALKEKEAKRENLRKRLLYGGATMAVVVGLVSVDHWLETTLFSMLLLCVMGALALLELFAMMRKHQVEPWWFVGVTFGILQFVAPWALYQLDINADFKDQSFTAVFLVFLLYLSIASVILPEHKRNFTNVAVTVFGVLYVPYLLSFILHLRLQHGGGSVGAGLAYMVVFGSKFTDIGAYFTGIAVGRHKLSSLSPKKTVEGAVGGVFFGAAVVLAVWSLFGVGEVVPASLALALAVLIPVVAQYGDLFESLIKRRYETKDSGVIPAMGGMLDMADSLLLNGPLVYFILLSQGCLHPGS